MREVVARLVEELEQVSASQFATLLETTLGEVEGVSEVAVWLVDFGFTQLHDLAGRREAIPVAGSRAGRVVLTGEPVLHQDMVFLPLGRRGQVMGVLELRGDLHPDLNLVAVVIADSLVATRRHSDVVDRVRGGDRLGLAATIQYELLPHPSCLDQGMEVAGMLEPAYDIAGDAFDYAINPEATYLALFDAVGHGLRSTTLTSLAVGTYRLMRRQGRSPAETAIAIDRAVAANGRPGEFVTGLLVELRPDQRLLRVWNGGHLPPLLIRDRNAIVVEPDPVLLPFGLGPEMAEPVTMPLQPEDQLFMYTDGVVQAKNSELAFWGLDSLQQVVTARVDERIPLFQVCRAVLQGVIDYVDGPLEDDATVVGLRWTG
ncbi:MAG TPA: PP2C family protein-serine/threonine phosphatase [Acidimicrobiia bacterium]|nr:PP2C family protein-serine/threonine phosphatase [Acidimicrobiia bacterium]